MDIEVYEFYQSRKVNVGWKGQSAELMFVLNGTSEDHLARAAFLSVFPASFFGLLFEDADIEPVGGLFWKATARYNSTTTQSADGQGGAEPGTAPPVPSGTDPVSPEYSFDISTVTEKITQSKQTISKTRRGGLLPAPDNQKAIGVTLDGNVEGCDRMSPHMEWSVTRVFGFVTLNYFQSLYALVGTTNNATFYGFPAGTLLFIGASLQVRDGTRPTMSYKFAARPNQTDIEICTDLVVPVKKGWEYLWVSYKNVDDAGKLFMQPDAAYVERIYDPSNFALLGIGA